MRPGRGGDHGAPIGAPAEAWIVLEADQHRPVGTGGRGKDGERGQGKNERAEQARKNGRSLHRPTLTGCREPYYFVRSVASAGRMRSHGRVGLTERPRRYGMPV